MSAFEGIRGPVTLPVDAQVVALVRLPIAITPLYDVVKTLDAAYGPGLVFRTDTGIDGWAVIARPESQEHEQHLEKCTCGEGWPCPKSQDSQVRDG